jgi:hypothetical protein
MVRPGGAPGFGAGRWGQRTSHMAHIATKRLPMGDSETTHAPALALKLLVHLWWRSSRPTPGHASVKQDFCHFNDSEIGCCRSDKEHEEQGRGSHKPEPATPGDQRQNQREGDSRKIHGNEEPARTAAVKAPPSAGSSCFMTPSAS